MIVYKLTSPSDKVYIGVTNKTAQNRFNDHCNDSRPRKLKTAIDKYGKDSFTIEVIDEAETLEELYNLERKYIKTFDSMNLGYNMTEGGEGTFGRKATKETKSRMSKARIGKKLSAKHKQAISKGNKTSEKSRAKRRLTWNVTLPDGTTTLTTNRREFCEQHNLNYGSVMTYTCDGIPYKGYLFEKVNS